MKRIFSILIALTMVLCLFACDNGGNGGGTAYTGDLDGEKTKLVINGNKATFSAEITNEIAAAKVKITQKLTQTGIIESNEDGVITVVFNKAGAAATMSMKITGSGAADYIKAAKAQFEGVEGAAGEAMLKLLNGKTLNMKYGDDYWETVGPTSGNTIVVKIDTTKKTFTQMDSGIG